MGYRMDNIYACDYVKIDRFRLTVESAGDGPRWFVNAGEDGVTVRELEYLAQQDDRTIRLALNRRFRVLPGRERYDYNARNNAEGVNVHIRTGGTWSAR
jgi:hypothetical protein